MKYRISFDIETENLFSPGVVLGAITDVLKAIVSVPSAFTPGMARTLKLIGKVAMTPLSDADVPKEIA